MTDGVTTTGTDSVGFLGASAGDAPGVLTDVAKPKYRERDSNALFVGILVGIAVNLAALFSFANNWPLAVAPVIVFVLGALCLWRMDVGHRGRIVARGEAFVQDNEDIDDYGLVIGLLGQGVGVLQFLVQLERWGAAIRIARERDFTPIEPIRVPFEPHLLGEGSPPLEIDTPPRGPSAAQSDSSATPGTWPSSRGLSGTAPRRRWSRTLGSVLAWVLIVILVADLLGSGALASRLPVMLVVVALVFLPRIFRKLYVSKQYLAVPGGLIAREGRVREQTCRLRVYDRRSSVLLATRLGSDAWTINVADATGQIAFTLKPEDAEFLLRAWLSPLEPPGVEQLSDLR